MTQRSRTIKGSAGLQRSLLAQDHDRRSRRTAIVEAESRSPAGRNDLLPRLQLVQRGVDLLRVPARNARTVDPAHVQDVENAIRAFGFSVPILIDGDGVVLDGVIRLEAAKRVGLQSVPCVIADHLTSAERKLLRLAANRLAEKGSWDLPELKLELEELIELHAPIEIIGFETTEIDQILTEDEKRSEPGPLDPERDAVAIAQPGDVFRLGHHRLVCGDARDPAVLAVAMNGMVAQLVLTDEPYNVGIVGNVTRGRHREFAMASGEMSDVEFDQFNTVWISTAMGQLVDGGVLATFIDWRGLMSVTAAARSAGLAQINLVVWGKTNAGMGSLYRSQHELLPLFKKGSAPHRNNIQLGRRGRHRSNLWSYPGASSLGSDARRGLQQHPTVKPVAMLTDALADLTNRGDVVIDPFLGSGSTLIAAEQCGRICCGVELDPIYVDLIVRRYAEVTGEDAILESTGESFPALEQRRMRERVPLRAD